jgi:hypothetical protein
MVVSTFYDIVKGLMARLVCKYWSNREFLERLDDFKYQGLLVSITSLDGQASRHEIPTTGLSHGMCSAPLRRWLDKARALPSSTSTRSALSNNVSPPLQALILPRGAARPERG